MNWSEGPDPPDILCVDSEGNRVGVELAEWLNEVQMAYGRRREQLQESYSAGINTAEEQPPRNIGLIWLFPGTPLDSADIYSFRRQLLEFISQTDANWSALENHDSPQGIPVVDFSGYPLLSRYLRQIDFFPRTVYSPGLGSNWITFPASGGSYSPMTAVEALLKVFCKKTGKYSTLCQDQSLAELYLLIYYDQGWAYNSPFEALGYGFKDIADELRAAAQRDPGPFNKVFLFVVANDEAIEVWSCA
ncbi:hypothetical protein MYX82_09940 [Acidobacteria bacterium AH-259-D05]|nr:hypothetical protein [Acidobacteria bacterium AH-259-D05]